MTIIYTLPDRIDRTHDERGTLHKSVECEVDRITAAVLKSLASHKGLPTILAKRNATHEGFVTTVILSPNLRDLLHKTFLSNQIRFSKYQEVNNRKNQLFFHMTVKKIVDLLASLICQSWTKIPDTSASPKVHSFDLPEINISIYNQLISYIKNEVRRETYRKKLKIKYVILECYTIKGNNFESTSCGPAKITFSLLTSDATVSGFKYMDTGTNTLTEVKVFDRGLLRNPL